MKTLDMKQTKKTIRHLKAALPEGAEFDEIETEDGGSFLISAPKWKVCKTLGTNSLCQSYWIHEEWNETRSIVISELIEYIKQGVELADEETIDEMGWNLEED